jgi:glycerol-3-phosphate cytidylyltransferase
MNIGYTTMTGDLLHKGHINFLQTARGLCDYLIVGLTTDELATKQKRVTWIPYNQRKAVISSLKYVDSVVEHTGQSKSEAMTMLNFKSLFIGDDYIGSEEYTTFQQSHPEILVYYLPRTSGVSSSSLIRMFENRIYDNMNIITYGIGGPMIRIKLDNNIVIIKHILLGYRESKSYDGSDSYGIAYPPPRNWKNDTNANTFPMISGVNGYREITIHELICDFRWNPFIKVVLVHSASHDSVSNLHVNNIDAMQYERSHPSKTYWLYQTYCGETLLEYMRRLESQNDYDHCKNQFMKICMTIKLYIQELNTIGVIHGDLHANNICINADDQVSFIDFGWCMSRSFQMKEDERLYLEDCLANDFDWIHFINSLHIFDLRRYLNSDSITMHILDTGHMESMPRKQDEEIKDQIRPESPGCSKTFV